MTSAATPTLLCGYAAAAGLAYIFWRRRKPPRQIAVLGSTNPGKLDALEQRFSNHTMALFEKHGIINIGYWKPLNKPNTLIYLVAHPSELEAATAWQAFGNDPTWQAVYANSIADGRLVENIERTFMLPTDYSPMPAR